MVINPAKLTHEAFVLAYDDEGAEWHFVILYNGKRIVEAVADCLPEAHKRAWEIYDGNYLPEMENFINKN